MILDKFRKVRRNKQMDALEQARALGLIDRDRAAREAEQARVNALEQMANGFTVNAQDAAIPPTPEWLAKGNVVPFRANRERWDSDVHVTTVRRLRESTIMTLWRKGSLTDEEFATAKWVADMWEQSGLNVSASIAAYDGRVNGGDKAFGAMPRTQFQAECRRNFRAALALVPTDPAWVARMFQAVVLIDIPVFLVEQLEGKDKKTIKRKLKQSLMQIYGGLGDKIPSLDAQGA